MITNFIKKIRLVRRIVRGIFQNYFEKIPSIPDGLSCFEIGKSVSGERIQCYAIGNGKIKIAFVSAIHGNEVGTFKLARNLLNYLYRDQNKLKTFSFLVVPCLNPDGFNLAVKSPDYLNGGRVGRFNTNNIDLNRNFETQSFKRESVWSFGKNYSENEKVFCGNSGNSEPETRAITKLLLENDVRCCFFFHNSGKDVMGNKNELSQKLARLYSQKAGLGLVSDEEWKILGQTGTAKEWCEDNDIAYVEIEGSTRWGSDWKKQKPAIAVALKELKNHYQS